MNRRPLGLWILVAAGLVGAGLVITGAVVANRSPGDIGIEGAYFNHSAGLDPAFAGTVDYGPSGTAWFVAGFLLLGTALAVWAIASRPRPTA